MDEGSDKTADLVARLDAMDATLQQLASTQAETLKIVKRTPDKIARFVLGLILAALIGTLLGRALLR